MEAALKIHVINAITKDICSVQNLVERIADKTSRQGYLETEITLLRCLGDFISEKSNGAFENINNLNTLSSMTKKLRMQASTLRSKIEFIYFDPEPLNDLFFELDIYLKSLLSHFTQLDIECTHVQKTLR